MSILSRSNGKAAQLLCPRHGRVLRARYTSSPFLKNFLTFCATDLASSQFLERAGLTIHAGRMSTAGQHERILMLFRLLLRFDALQ